MHIVGLISEIPIAFRCIDQEPVFLLPDVFQTKEQITPKMTAKFNTKIVSRKKPPISLNMVASLAPLSKVGIGMLVLKCRPYLAQKNGFKKMEISFSLTPSLVD